MAEKKRYVATWKLTSPAFNSIEDTTYGEGFLGTDYTQGVDHRWEGALCLGPEINSIDLSAAGGTAANTVEIVDSGGMNATKYLYVIRGTKWAKVSVASGAFTLVSDGTETALAEAGTGALRTRNFDGTEEISVFMDNTAYRVITTVSSGATDTHAANSGGLIARIGANMDSKNQVGRVGLLGRSGAAGTATNTIYENVLATSISMAAPSESVVGTITDRDVSFTSLGIDDGFWVPGTTYGPYFVDANYAEFRPLVRQASDAANKVIQVDWYGMNLLIASSKGTRYSKALSGESVGPGRFPFNTSPVKGYCTAAAGTERWLYWVEYDGTYCYLLAARPRQSGDPHGQPLSFYCLARLAGYCQVLRDLDRMGGATFGQMVGGEGSNMFWFRQGRWPREIDESAYRFTASGGDWYGTELRRQTHWRKRVLWAEFETASCTATATVALKLSVDGGTTYEQLGGTVATNGPQRWVAKVDDPVWGLSLKPRFTLATGANTTTPKVTGTLRIGYELEAAPVDGEYLEEVAP